MNRGSGLALVELLVAMLLVLAVVAGSLAFVARGRAAHRTGEALAQLEEALDAAYSALVDEIRMAGYLGLAAPATPVAGASATGAPELPGLEVAGSCGASLAHDLAHPVVAIDGAFAAAPDMALGCRPSPAGRHVAQADTLVLRHAARESTRPEPGRLQLESSLRAAALAADGAGSLGADARWHDLEVGIYYVSADSTGRTAWPSLRRKRLVGGMRPAFQDEELVSGIADFQIGVGLDDDGDAAVDRWIVPGDRAAGGVPRALRIEIEAQSEVAEPSQPGGMRRKRASRVVELRNSAVRP